MIFCFGGSLKTHTKCVCLESVRVGHIDILCTTFGIIHHGAQFHLKQGAQVFFVPTFEKWYLSGLS